MKKTKIFIGAVIAIACLACVLAFTACGSAQADATYWYSHKGQEVLEVSQGAEMEVSRQYNLEISGDSYKLTIFHCTYNGEWITTLYNATLYGTCSVSSSGTESTYTLAKPTRAIYAQGPHYVIGETMDATYHDSADSNTWPEAAEGDDATTADTVIALGVGLLPKGDIVTGSVSTSEIVIKVNTETHKFVSVELK